MSVVEKPAGPLGRGMKTTTSESNMADDQSAGERPSAAAAPDDQVRERLTELARHKRGRVRWRMSKHTAELAIRALGDQPAARPGGRAKQRRRKRHKRLL